MRRFALPLRKAQVAEWISIAGHPFVFSPIVALLVGAYLFGPVESVIGLLTVILAMLSTAGFSLHPPKSKDRRMERSGCFCAER